MQVTVRLHAQAVDLAGAANTSVQLDEPATCADVKRALVVQHPALGALAAVSAMASDHEYLADGASVEDQAALHLIPPVSGG